MDITLTIATADDLATINERYAQIDFVPSGKGELIVQASYNGLTAGQGRVVPVDEQSGELGGIYVFPGCEGLGIARKVVEFLINQTEHSVLYCLPFAELEGFYRSMGFRPVGSMAQIPQAVLKKHQWCLNNYDKPVLLLER